jgi:hypothetical protein
MKIEKKKFVRNYLRRGDDRGWHPQKGSKMKKLLIESYSKFNNTHKKYFKSPALHLDRYGFMNIGGEFRYKIVGSPRQYIRDFLESRKIKTGHIVYRWTTASFGEHLLEIWYNKKILNEYGKEV